MQAYGGDQVDDQTGEGRFAGRPVRRPELAAEGEGDALFRELLVDAGGGEGLENGYFFTTIFTGGWIRTMVTTFCGSRSQYTHGHGMGQTYAGVRCEQEGNIVRFASLPRNDTDSPKSTVMWVSHADPTKFLKLTSKQRRQSTPSAPSPRTPY